MALYRSVITFDLLQKEADFTVNNPLLAFLGAATELFVYLRSDLRTIYRSFSLLSTVTLRSLWSRGTVRLSVLWDNK